MLSFIGDIHSDFGTLSGRLKKKKLKESDLVIAVGDVGIGFPANYYTHPEWATNIEFPNNFRFIRGNHDNPAVCKQHPNYLGEWGYLPEHSLFYVGGAFSIDREWRKENVNWWADEQLSVAELGKAVEEYKKLKPRIMVTHDCPQSILHRIFDGTMHPLADKEYVDKMVHCDTRNALQVMFESWSPDFWVHGHHHRRYNKSVHSCKFICIPPMQIVTLDIKDEQIVRLG